MKLAGEMTFPALLMCRTGVGSELQALTKGCAVQEESAAEFSDSPRFFEKICECCSLYRSAEQIKTLPALLVQRIVRGMTLQHEMGAPGQRCCVWC